MQQKVELRCLRSARRRLNLSRFRRKRPGPRQPNRHWPRRPPPPDRAQNAVVPMMAAKPAAREPAEPIAGVVHRCRRRSRLRCRRPLRQRLNLSLPHPTPKRRVRFSVVFVCYACGGAADTGQSVPRLRRSHPRHVLFSIPDDDGQARHTRTRRADLRAGPAAQAKTPCHRRPRRSRGAIAAAPARADQVTATRGAAHFTAPAWVWCWRSTFSSPAGRPWANSPFRSNSDGLCSAGSCRQ